MTRYKMAGTETCPTKYRHGGGLFHKDRHYALKQLQARLEDFLHLDSAFFVHSFADE